MSCLLERQVSHLVMAYDIPSRNLTIAMRLTFSVSKPIFLTVITVLARSLREI